MLRALATFGGGIRMRITNDYYLIVDLEATCSDDGSVPRHEMEIIEIGALMQNSHTFEVEGEFQMFVRPERHAELTDFCRNLTGITQDDVTAAPRFPEALLEMNDWSRPFGDSLFCSWGEYDRNQFRQDCEFHNCPYPFGSAYMNLKAEVSRTLGRRKRFGLAEAVRRLGMEFEGSHHRGLDDARNIARVVRRVCLGAPDDPSK